MGSIGKQFSSFRTGTLRGKAIGWDRQLGALAYDVIGISIRVNRQLGFGGYDI